MTSAQAYERIAPRWERSMRRLGYAEAYKTLLENNTIAVGPVLDVGCGTGTFASMWCLLGGSTDLTLLDSSPAMLNRAETNLSRLTSSLNPVCKQLDEYTCEKPFLTILAAHIIEQTPAPADAMATLARALGPSGRLFLIVSHPHWCQWILWPRYRHRWFNEQCVLEMATQAGLSHLHTCSFPNGPPRRTSRGYIFMKHA